MKRKIIKPENIGQYLYKYNMKSLKKLFPKKTINQIRRIIRW